MAAPVISSAGASETTAGLIPRKVLFGNPVKASPQISPDGKKLAYLAPADGVLNVYIRTLGKDDDQVVTSDTKRGIRNYFWRPDSLHILYIQDRDGDENWHLYQTRITDKQTTNLTPHPGVRVQNIATGLDHPDEVVFGMNVRDRKLFDMYRADLRTGAIDLITSNPGDVSDFHADNDLKVRGAQVMKPDGSILIRLRNDDNDDWRDWMLWSADENFPAIYGFTADNNEVFLESSIGANTSRLLQVNLEAGTSKVIAEDPAYDIEGILQNPHTHELEGYRIIRARRDWTILAPGIKEDFERLRKLHAGDMEIQSRDYDDEQWIVSYMADNAPEYWVHYDRRTKTPTLLFSNRPDLEHYTLAEMKPISFKARDGLTIHGYLTMPPGKDARNQPMVMHVHGGPWGRDVWGLNYNVQWLANRGYGVLQVNFRGSTGYGKEVLNAGDREWGGKMLHDLLDAKKWAVEQGYADPKRFAVYGGSYGGYAVLSALTFAPGEFSCGVNVVGVSNIITLLKTIPPYWEPIKALFLKRVGDPEKDEEFLKSRSPLFMAHRINVPLLIAHGANDPRVKQAEADQIVEAMRKNRQSVEYIVFPDEGHGFARPENRLKFFAAMEQFLAKHLGGRAEPPAPDEDWAGLRN